MVSRVASSTYPILQSRETSTCLKRASCRVKFPDGIVKIVILRSIMMNSLVALIKRIEQKFLIKGKAKVHDLVGLALSKNSPAAMMRNFNCLSRHRLILSVIKTILPI